MASSFQLSVMAVLLLVGALALFAWTHASLTHQDLSLRQARRSQQLESQIQLLLGKHKALEQAAAAKVNSGDVDEDDFVEKLRPTKELYNEGVTAEKLLQGISREDSNEFKLAREVSHRYHTRYWLENKHKWPKNPLPVLDKFLSFEPWGGGFNNIRMSLEMAAAMAIALNRTLVMPPTYHMYLRGTSNFQDYFDYADMQRGLSVVTYQEFRRLVGMNEFDNQGDAGPDTQHMSKFFQALRAMPASRVAILTEKSGLGAYENKIGSQLVFCFPVCEKGGEWFKKIHHKLTPVSTGDFPQIFEEPQILHFGPMLLGHFYTMVWFQDPRRGQAVKRIVRDHVHFHEEMFALAERVVQQLGGDFAFSCLHVRRNDFQFKEVWTPAEQIVKNVERLWDAQETIYIATDELSKKDRKQWDDPLAMSRVKDHAWFEPMFQAWGGRERVKFWSDYHELLHLNRDVKKIWIGSVESIVCSRARVFVGTQKSTFSGYIYRLRGYMHDVGQTEYLEAQSKYPEDYYKALPGPSWANFPHGAFGGGHPYWGREYSESFRGVYDPFY